MKEKGPSFAKQALHDLHGLGEPRDAHARLVERNAGGLVVGGHPTRADPELEPTVGEQVERRHLARAHNRMLVVVAEHERADAQRVGDGRGVRERDRRREVVVDEVVGNEQRRVPERLDLAGELRELLARTTLADPDTETKWLCSHGVGPYRPLPPARRPPTADAGAVSSSISTSSQSMSYTR